MRFHPFVASIATVAALSLGASPVLANDKIRYRFCNNDSAKRVSMAYASYNLGVATTRVEGWYNAEAGRCVDVWLWNSSDWTHHFVFFSSGKRLDFGPPKYSWLKQSSDKFCIDPGEGFSISETIFSSGRSTDCRGREVLTPFTFKVAGGYLSEVNVDLPRISSAAPKEKEGSPLLNYLLKWL